MAKRKSKAEESAGRLSTKDIRKLINKKAGVELAYDLNESNPTEVVDWIPTGSRWLDSIICKGKRAGIPVGKVTELSGLESSGKSYFAAQIAGNAQKMGITVVYFDAESAIDPAFLELAGCDLDKLVYMQAENVETVLETMEALMQQYDGRLLFVWDSIALTPCKSDIEGNFDPSSSMAVKARVLSKGFQKLLLPIANAEATLLYLNQLKTNITNNIGERFTTPYFTPGGKALAYSSSLRIWLTRRKAKATFITDDNGYRIGTTVKAKLEKSRFGTEGRICDFSIIWGGDEVRVMDEESWQDAIKSSEYYSGGQWHKLIMEDGKEVKFRNAEWLEKLKDEKFKTRVLQIMDEEVIHKFAHRLGKAENYYDEDFIESAGETKE